MDNVQEAKFELQVAAAKGYIYELDFDTFARDNHVSKPQVMKWVAQIIKTINNSKEA